MRAGVDVGVDAQGHAAPSGRAAAAAAEMRAISSSLSALNSPMPASEAERDLLVRLPHAGEDDALGREPGAQRGPQLERRTRCPPPRPAPARRRRIAPDAVGLERVADAMGHGARTRGRRRGRPPRSRRGCRRRAACRGARRRPRGTRRRTSSDAVPRGRTRVMPRAAGRLAASASRRVAAATPLRPITPTRFGKICSPFMRSPQAQTVSTLPDGAEHDEPAVHPAVGHGTTRVPKTYSRNCSP